MPNIYDQLIAEDRAAKERMPPNSDIYDQLIAEDLAQEQAARETFLEEAAKGDPDQSATAQQLATKTGLSVDLVERNLDQVKRMQLVRNVQTAVAGRPILSRQLTDPEFAKIAYDNVQSLGGIEEYVGAMARYVIGADPKATLFRDLSAVPARAVNIAAGAGRVPVEIMATPERMFNRALGRDESLGWWANWSSNLGRAAAWGDAKASELGSQWSPNSIPAQIFGGGASSGVQSSVMSMGTLAAASWLLGPATGIPATLLLLSAGQGGASFTKSFDAGKGLVPSLIHGGGDAAAEYVGEKFFGLAGFAKRAFSGASAKKLLAYELTREPLGEMGTQVWQNFNEWQVMNPEKSMSDFLDEQPLSMAQAAVGAIVGGGAQIGAVKLADRLIGQEIVSARNAQFAEQNAQLLDGLVKLAASDKVLARNPESFQTFLQAMNPDEGPAHTLYFQASDLQETGVAQQLAQVSPSIAAQLPEALQTGALVAVPVDEVLTHIAPTEYAQSLVDIARVNDPQAWTRREGQAYEESAEGQALNEYVERQLAERQDDDTFTASRDAVKGQILADMNAVGRFSEAKNEVDAMAYASYYAVRAAQMGVTPEELYARRRVLFAGRSGGGFEQALAEQPPKGWVHSSSGQDAAALFNGQTDAQAVFWTDLQGKLAQDAPALAGYSHSVDASAVQHIKSQHGDVQAESKRGQVGVMPEDVARIPDVVTQYDDARWEREDRGSKLVAFAKQVDDGVLVYLARVSDRRRNMAAVSMMKFKPGVEPSVALARALQEKAPHKAGTDSKPRTLSDYESDARARNPRVSINQGGEFRQPQEAPDQQGYIDGEPYRPEHEALSEADERAVIDAYNASATTKLDSVGKIEDSDDIGAKARAFQALVQREGWHFHKDAQGAKYFWIENADGATLNVRVSDHANVNRGEHYKTSNINIAPDDGVNGFDTFSSALWKMRHASINEDLDTLIDGQEPVYFQSMWHGTPHRGIENEGFKLNKIGTGEGAQAYGWGMYFASMREVAQKYQPRNEAAEAAMLAEYNAAERKGDYEALELWEAALMHTLSDEIVSGQGFEHIPKPKREAVARKMQAIGKKHAAAGGNLYGVALPIEDSDLLDWDKPLNEQPQKVRAALATTMHDMRAWNDDGITYPNPDVLSGEGLYGALERHLGGPRAASEYLDQIGIPGLRYLDGNSRSDGKGSHNYVIWDEALLTPEAAQIQAYYQSGLAPTAQQQFRDTEKAYGGKPAYDKAKAAGQTKLTYGQWVQVRTENFKRWFGDWLAARGVKALADMQAAKLDSVQALADKAAVEEAFRKFAPAENKADGRVVRFPTSMAGKIVRHKGFDVRRIASAFDRLFADAVPMASQVEQVREGHKDHTRNIEAYHDYVSKFEQDGKTYYARFTVQQMRGAKGESLAHSSFVSEVSVYEAKGASPGSARGRVIDPVLAEGVAPFDGILAQWLEAGNPDAVSKVVDPETGEPMVVYHGTNRSFDVFNIRAGNTDAVLGVDANVSGGGAVASRRALYFASESEGGQVEAYASRDGGNIMPVFVVITNPASVNQFLASGVAADEGRAVSALEGQGHDGVIYEGVKDGNVVIAFAPTQIKSATGNVGTFDPANPDILHQKARGSFNPETLTVSLLKGADLSTALHEGAHFFFENDIMLASEILASQAQGATILPGEQEILNDVSALFKWHGIQGDLREQLAQWFNMSHEEKTAHHERTAESLERYWLEGNAPSIELQPYFQKYRAWMLDVYKSIRDFLAGHPEAGKLDDEIRRIFDRMLATSEQIKLAEESRSLMPLFTNPAESGMSVEDQGKYQSDQREATATAIDQLQARVLKDQQWRANARAREIKRLQRRHKALRAEMQIEARRQVLQAPIYRVYQFLTNKIGEEDKLPAVAQPQKTAEINPAREMRPGEQAFGLDEIGAGRLDLGALQEMYGSDESPVQALKSRRLTAKNGLHPDIVAELFGFDSGDQMARALAGVPTLAEAVQAATDQMMLERHGDLSTPEAIERAADMAVHNEARARLLAAETNALEQAVGKRKTLMPLAKQYAADIVARLTVRNLLPGRYTSAETRAAKLAQKAKDAGDLVAAAAEKRNQMVQHYAARATYDAQDEVDAGLRYLRKFLRRRPKSLDADYAEQIEALLERYDLRQSSNKETDRRKSLRSWVMGQIANGEVPDIAMELLAPQDRSRFIAQTAEINEHGEYVYAEDGERAKLLADYIERAAKTSWRDLSVEQFRGLVETVKQIEHIGQLKNRLLTQKEGVLLGAVKDEIDESIRKNALKSGKAVPTRDDLGRRMQKIKRFGADHIRMAIRALVMDGGKDLGPMFRYFIQPANQAEGKQLDMRAAATERLNEIVTRALNGVPVADRVLKGRYYESVGASLNWQARFAVLLNMGNEGNMQRLLSGGLGGRQNIALQDVMPILSEFTAEQIKAAQEIWDLMDSYRPELAELERETKGKEPDWIEPRRLTIRSSDGQMVTLRGGYFPVVYDPALNQRVADQQESEEASRAARAAKARSVTQQSFTKARANEVNGRPLLLTLDAVFSGIESVIHDLSFRRYSIDAGKLLRSKRIQDAIREHYGAESIRQLRNFVDDLVAGPQRLNDSGEQASSFIRQNVSASGLALNVVNWMQQPFGIHNAVVRLGGGAEGAKWVGLGMVRYMKNPVAATREAMQASAFMKNRPRTRFRELNEIRNKVQFEGLRAKVTPFMMSGMVYSQLIADTIAWHAARARAVHENPAIDDESLIAVANQVVRDSQGGGEDVDLSAIERGSPMMKLFTVFFNFQNTGTNLAYLSLNTRRGAAKRAVDMFMVFVMPVLVNHLAKEIFRPGDDDKDKDEILKKLLVDQLTYLTGSFAFVREINTATEKLFGEGYGGYQGPSGLRPFVDLAKLAEQANQGEMDDAMRKAIVNMAGDVFGAPSAAINRAITGAQALHEGKTENPLVIGFGFKERR